MEKLLQYATVKQVKKLVFNLHGVEMVELAILEFLSSCTSICLCPNLNTLFSEIKSVVLFVVRTRSVVALYIYDAAVYFQLFVGFLLFQLLRFFSII